MPQGIAGSVSINTSDSVSGWGTSLSSFWSQLERQRATQQPSSNWLESLRQSRLSDMATRLMNGETVYSEQNEFERGQARLIAFHEPTTCWRCGCITENSVCDSELCESMIGGSVSIDDIRSMSRLDIVTVNDPTPFTVFRNGSVYISDGSITRARLGTTIIGDDTW